MDEVAVDGCITIRNTLEVTTFNNYHYDFLIETITNGTVRGQFIMERKKLTFEVAVWLLKEVYKIFDRDPRDFWTLRCIYKENLCIVTNDRTGYEIKLPFYQHLMTMQINGGV